MPVEVDQVGKVTALRFTGQIGSVDGGAYASVPYFMPNLERDQAGNDGPPTPKASDKIATSYIRFHHFPTLAASLNSAGDSRLFGLDRFDVFTPLEVGMGTALKIAQAIRSMFLNYADDTANVYYLAADGRQPWVEIAGRTEDEARFLAQTFVPWQAFTV